MCACVCICACMCVCVCLCMCACVCIFMCVHVCVFRVCLCVCVCTVAAYRQCRTHRQSLVKRSISRSGNPSAQHSLYLASHSILRSHTLASCEISIDTLQPTHCKTLQYAATHCNTLQHMQNTATSLVVRKILCVCYGSRIVYMCEQTHSASQFCARPSERMSDYTLGEYRSRPASAATRTAKAATTAAAVFAVAAWKVCHGPCVSFPPRLAGECVFACIYRDIHEYVDLCMGWLR